MTRRHPQGSVKRIRQACSRLHGVSAKRTYSIWRSFYAARLTETITDQDSPPFAGALTRNDWKQARRPCMEAFPITRSSFTGHPGPPGSTLNRPSRLSAGSASTVLYRLLFYGIIELGYAPLAEGFLTTTDGHRAIGRPMPAEYGFARSNKKHEQSNKSR